MTTTQTQTTLGQGLLESDAVKHSFARILSELRDRSAQITDIRGPNGGASESYQAFMDRAGKVRGRGLYYPYVGSGLGNGALVELADGSVKWDMICGIGVHFFGHSDPGLIEAALYAALDDTVKHGNLQSNREAFTFAETLAEQASRQSRLKHCFLSTGGAMANENALKLCFQKRAPASRVIAFKDCFMGRTLTMSQIGDAAAYRAGMPLSTLVDYMPFYDAIEAEKIGETQYIERAVAQLQEYIDRYPGQHACFIFEMIQGEGGFNSAPRAFHEALMQVCKANEIAVWIDEIQTFGRTESMFAFETLGLGDYVDVLCVGKMTQACATLFTEDYNPKPGLLSGTFTGETVSFRVGQQIIERLRDGDYYGPDGSNARHNALFNEQVRALKDKHPDWFPPVAYKVGSPGATDIVGGVGGMLRFTPFGGDKSKIVAACGTCFDEGVILFYCGHDPYHLRMLPPLGVMNESDWPRVFACVERGLARAAS
jgi:4-aminobutyrate aminotransferase-like enzyme